MSQHKLEIFGVPQSNFTRAVRMVCAEKSVNYDYVPVPPHSPEARAVHPLGKIPGLRHGTLSLGESRAIVAYLDQLYPEIPMVPADPEVEQWVSIITTAIDPVLVRQYVFANIFPDTPDGTVDRAAVDAMLPRVEALTGFLDGALGNKSFLAAGRFTFADALLLSILAAVRLFPEGARAMDAAPNLSRYLARHASRPSFIATDPWQAPQQGEAA